MASCPSWPMLTRPAGWRRSRRARRAAAGPPRRACRPTGPAAEAAVEQRAEHLCHGPPVTRDEHAPRATSASAIETTYSASEHDAASQPVGRGRPIACVTRDGPPSVATPPISRPRRSRSASARSISPMMRPWRSRRCGGRGRGSPRARSRSAARRRRPRRRLAGGRSCTRWRRRRGRAWAARRRAPSGRWQLAGEHDALLVAARQRAQRGIGPGAA